MDNLLSAFENGVPLTRTSSDPNLNKHCQEGRSKLETSSAVEDASADGSEEVTADTRVEEQSGHQSPAQNPEVVSAPECVEDKSDEPCLTTQPLPSPPLPPVTVSTDITHSLSAFSTPVLHQALPQNTNPALPALPLEEGGPHSTAESTTSPAHNSEPCLPLPCKNTQPAANPPTSLLNGHLDGHVNGLAESASLPGLKQQTPLIPMEDSTETLTDEGELPSTPPPAVTQHLTHSLLNEKQADLQPPVVPQKEKEDMRTEVAKGRERLSSVAAAALDCTQVNARHLISRSQLSDLSLLGSHWDSVQGLVQSACSHSAVSRALQPNTYQSRQLASKLLRAQGLAIATGSQCCRREALCCSPLQLSAARSAGYNGLCGPAVAILNSYSLAGHQLQHASYSSPSASSSPPPSQAPAYLDDDGLPVPMDAVQQRLRQIEAGYKQEVEVLRQQVRQLQMRLESKQYSTPPSEPDVDYEDDIVSFCLSVFLLSAVEFFSRFCVTHVLSSWSVCFRPVCGSQTTATRRILCPLTARTVCRRAAGIEWSARTRRSAPFVA